MGFRAQTELQSRVWRFRILGSRLHNLRFRGLGFRAFRVQGLELGVESVRFGVASAVDHR